MTVIPRFLLPQQSSIWRRGIIPSSKSVIYFRNASSKAPRVEIPQKSNLPRGHRVLEKPTKFNPPSHGSRLRKDPPQYPGPALSSEQKLAQKSKKYPNSLPPEGSFFHWFLNNRSIHLYITLGTLFSLAGYTTVTNFKRTSPFADMLPHASDLFFHPIAFTRTCIEVLRLHTAHVSAETAERRKRRVDDVQKRSDFRKAHGLDTDDGIGGWTAKTDIQNLGPAIPSDGSMIESPTTGEAVANSGDGGKGEHIQQISTQKKPLRKWLGIW